MLAIKILELGCIPALEKILERFVVDAGKQLADSLFAQRLRLLKVDAAVPFAIGSHARRGIELVNRQMEKSTRLFPAKNINERIEQAARFRQCFESPGNADVLHIVAFDVFRVGLWFGRIREICSVRSFIDQTLVGAEEKRKTGILRKCFQETLAWQDTPVFIKTTDVAFGAAASDFPDWILFCLISLDVDVPVGIGFRCEEPVLLPAAHYDPLYFDRNRFSRKMKVPNFLF